MGTASPLLDQWYTSASQNQPFQVVALAEDYARIRRADGYHEVVWLDDWDLLEAALIPPPPGPQRTTALSGTAPQRPEGLGAPLFCSGDLKTFAMDKEQEA